MATSKLPANQSLGRTAVFTLWCLQGAAGWQELCKRQLADSARRPKMAVTLDLPGHLLSPASITSTLVPPCLCVNSLIWRINANYAYNTSSSFHRCIKQVDKFFAPPCFLWFKITLDASWWCGRLLGHWWRVKVRLLFRMGLSRQLELLCYWSANRLT